MTGSQSIPQIEGDSKSQYDRILQLIRVVLNQAKPVAVTRSHPSGTFGRTDKLYVC